jgi:hypothetical protein
MKLKHVVLASAVIATSVAAIALRPSDATILPTVPGAINQDITQDTIGQTICNPNWSTRSERPPSAYTTALKIKQLKTLGWSDQSTADYEEDHLISLELGGNPTDPNNLWPESYKTTPNARDKDKVENYLHAEVCNGAMTLQEAQKEVSGDWTKIQTNSQYGAATPVNDPDDD